MGCCVATLMAPSSRKTPCRAILIPARNFPNDAALGGTGNLPVPPGYQPGGRSPPTSTATSPHETSILKLPQCQRHCVTKPRVVTFAGLPWETGSKRLQPQSGLWQSQSRDRSRTAICFAENLFTMACADGTVRKSAISRAFVIIYIKRLVYPFVVFLSRIVGSRRTIFEGSNIPASPWKTLHKISNGSGNSLVISQELMTLFD
jgi:hypothetical protein